jgi:lysophospholipase L1-like esterase/quercetin dioxygenase-like cupin family protein
MTEFWRPEFFKENTSFVNRGISGQTTPQMLLRFRQDVIDLTPSAVVILAGINDIAHNTGPSTIKMIADNIISMAELAKTNDIEVFLCSVLPANNFPWRKAIKPADNVIALNSLIKGYAEKHNIKYVDFYSAMVNGQKGLQADLGSDGVHPNAKGYAIMESIITRAISNSIRKPDLPDPLEAGWNGQKVCKVLKEDENQRILKCSFPPNVGHEKHHHAPHFGYTLKGGTFRITDDKGTKEIKVKDGTTWSKSDASVHEVLNVGETTSVYLIIEAKN